MNNPFNASYGKEIMFVIYKINAFFNYQIFHMPNCLFNLSNSEKLPCWLKTRIAANARSGNVLATACRPGRSANVKEEKAAAGQHCRRGWSQRSERAAHAGQPQESAKPQLHPRRGNWQQLHPTKSFFFSLLDFFFQVRPGCKRHFYDKMLWLRIILSPNLICICIY